jgi:hypothetical protein
MCSLFSSHVESNISLGRQRRSIPARGCTLPVSSQRQLASCRYWPSLSPRSAVLFQLQVYWQPGSGKAFLDLVQKLTGAAQWADLLWRHASRVCHRTARCHRCCQQVQRQSAAGTWGCSHESNELCAGAPLTGDAWVARLRTPLEQAVAEEKAGYERGLAAGPKYPVPSLLNGYSATCFPLITQAGRLLRLHANRWCHAARHLLAGAAVVGTPPGCALITCDCDAA